jgi:ABC-2 type transport system ATP-binding protein
MIKISNLSVCYGKNRAVDNLTLEIQKGESILLAGANGSGKTTLLRSITGILFPNAGRVFIDGKDVNYQSRQKAAYIPASISFYDGLTLSGAKKLYRAVYKDFKYREIGDYVFDEKRKIGSLSKGEKTLFFLSLALSSSPEYLLIDDVIHFLDPHLREIFLQSILHLIEEKQLSVVIAAQSSFDVEGILERVLVLDKGKIILDQSVESLKKTFVKIYSEKKEKNIPVVFSRQWEGLNELYIYPYYAELKIKEKIHFLALPEILRAFIGGEYGTH